MSELSNSHDLGTSSPSGAPLTETEVALLEIDEAARIAFKSVEDEQNEALGAAPAQAALADSYVARPRVDFSTLTDEQKKDRIKVFTKRAASQRDRGRAELERVYAGAMSVKMNVSWNDLTVASSCERFLGMCDLSPYTIGRRGPSVLGSKATTTVLEQFSALVEKYYEAGMLAKRGAQALFDAERDHVFGDDEWVTPEYTTAAFAMVIHAKNRSTTRIVAGMAAWDEAIRLASVLEWNGKIETSKISDLREQERKGMYSIFSFARRSLIGLYKGTLKVEATKPAKELGAPAEAVPAAADTELTTA